MEKEEVAGKVAKRKIPDFSQKILGKMHALTLVELQKRLSVKE